MRIHASFLFTALPLFGCAGAAPAASEPQAPEEVAEVSLTAPEPQKSSPKDPKLARDKAAREAAREAAINAELRGAIKSSSDSDIASMFSSRALSNDDIAGGLKGDSIGTAFGGGGLGLRGTGSGGGGTGQGTIGLGSIGTLGHSPGTGTGAGYGSGFGRLGAQSPLKVNVGAPTATGKLAPEVIRRIVRAHITRLHHCYERSLQQDPNLQGKIAVRFVIEPNGAVSSVADAGSTITDKAMMSCTLNTFQAMLFPAPEGGGKVVVTYPLVFAQPDSPPATATPPAAPTPPAPSAKPAPSAAPAPPATKRP